MEVGAHLGMHLSGILSSGPFISSFERHWARVMIILAMPELSL